ncbi:MAG: hypothetical protein V1784_02185 [bacterium]
MIAIVEVFRVGLETHHGEKKIPGVETRLGDKLDSGRGDTPPTAKTYYMKYKQEYAR